MVVKAEGTGHLPNAILVLPERNEFCFSDLILLAWVMETMNADLHRTVVGYRIHLQRSSDELPCDFAAYIVLDTVDQRLAANCQAGLIVVKLQVLGNQGGYGCQIAVVVGVKEFGVQRLDRLEEAVRRSGGMRLGPQRGRIQQNR